MPIALLPASAAAFAPRAPPTVVLGSKVDAWLTQALKRVNRVRRPLNSVIQHSRCLTDVLSGENAIWSLCSIMLPRAPDAELRRDPDPLVEALFNYQLLHVRAYVVHVDMVAQHDVAWKLTEDSIDALVTFHRQVFSVDAAAATWDWPEKEEHLRRLHHDFRMAVNRYVFRAPVRALDGIEDEGAGELLEGRGQLVKAALTDLFLPLLPPPPRILDVVHAQPTIVQQNEIAISTLTAALPSQSESQLQSHQLQSQSRQQQQQQFQYQQQQQLQPQQQLQQQQQQLQQQPSPAPEPYHSCRQSPAPMEPWEILSCTDSMTGAAVTTSADPTSFWATMPELIQQLPSPSPSYSQPYTASDYFSSPECSVAIPVSMPMSMPVSLPLALPMPTMMSQPCGSSLAGTGYGALSWGHGNYASHLTPIM